MERPSLWLNLLVRSYWCLATVFVEVPYCYKPQSLMLSKGLAERRVLSAKEGGFRKGDVGHDDPAYVQNTR
ncbi:hypothetical protein F4861DRAFT_526404 [Xylaria intraflava]|nr:hypothetical protein F4861DRAFT_526404 [Xylaria intraflava]